MRRFWIDTDTASDDAVAILMALRWPEVQVDGISIVAGNVPVHQGSRNARHTVELCGAATPVYNGVERPLLREPVWSWLYHGEGGMSGMALPDPGRAVEREHGVNALIDAVRAAPGEITLVTLGPLTNIAVALRMAPDIAEKIPHCYVMGGAAATLGNTTPAAEYNIWFDPEAARIVFLSGLCPLMVGWEHSRGPAMLDRADLERVRALDTPLARFTLACCAAGITANEQWLGEVGLSLPDPVTMAIALDPAVCARRDKHFVDVEVHGEAALGMTLVDQYGYLKKEPNAEVCWELDAARWKEMLFTVLGPREN
jgi:purine nucleosidase